MGRIEVCRMGLWAAALCLAVSGSGAPANGESSSEAGGIPARFRGAGCNLKYSYLKPLRTKAEECAANRVDADKAGAEKPREGGSYIRISSDRVAGAGWDCRIKQLRDANERRASFAGDCSENGKSFAATVTLTLRPGSVVSVDTFSEGNHVNNDYRLQAGVE
jgi:hypothetical protein